MPAAFFVGEAVELPPVAVAPLPAPAAVVVAAVLAGELPKPAEQAAL
jgi:hypothetical protein